MVGWMPEVMLNAFKRVEFTLFHFEYFFKQFFLF